MSPVWIAFTCGIGFGLALGVIIITLLLGLWKD